MKQWLVLFSIVAVMVIAQETFTAVDYQGTQIIDTKFSYMFNLRYANGSSTLYFRADKSHPNVFSATFQGNEPKNFKISTKSPFPNAPAFFAFDAITNKGVDYIVGSTFPRQGSKPVLPIVVANTKDKVSDVTGGTYENYYLYTPVIDSSSLNINTDKVNVYFAGWGMGGDAKGLIISKVEATLNVDNPQAQILSLQTLVINEHCYDIWNDINKPHLFIDNINGKKYLILVVTGRCDGIWKIEVNDEFMKSSSLNFIYDHPGDSNSEIFSSAYDFKNHVAFFTLKKYNSDDLSLHLISMTPTDAIAPSPVIKVLGKNDSNPLLAFDRHNDNLMFLSSDNDHIYKIAGKDITGKTTPYQIATLPPKLKQVSSARVFGDFLYMVTYEPDAQFARISMTANFCQQFCGAYGFCAQPPKLCRCAEGYVYNLSATATDNQVCVPKHEEEVVKKTIEEKGAAIALGVLFFIALIGAAAGWVMWWRSRQSQYMNVSN